MLTRKDILPRRFSTSPIHSTNDSYDKSVLYRKKGFGPISLCNLAILKTSSREELFATTLTGKVQHDGIPTEIVAILESVLKESSCATRNSSLSID